MNVVVGKSQHKTAVFNGDVKYVVFSPYWNIPASIMKNETLPGIRRNPKYLAQHNMEWNGNQIRQKLGPNNSLGLVKFLFPKAITSICMILPLNHYLTKPTGHLATVV